MDDILPLLRERLAALELDIRRSEAHIRMQLTPKKAAEIQKQWKKETGKGLSIPTPFDEKNKKAAVDEAIESLFEDEVKRAAIHKWITLFENRHSRFGLKREMGIYQEGIGDIKTQHRALERQVNGYMGFPAQEIRQIQTLEGDLSDREMEQLQAGEIGITRADLYQVQQKAAIRIRSVWNWSVTIPNHQTAETIIMNYSGQNVWHGGSIYLPPGQNPLEIEKLLIEILETIDIIDEPWVMYAGFNDWAAEYWVYYLVPFAERNTVKNQVHNAIWQEFNRHGIKPMLKKFHNVS
jgi:hypothetical protein